MRVSEPLNLGTGDMLVGAQEAILLLGVTKRGVEQRVVIANAIVVAFLRRYMCWRKSQPGTRLCPVSYGTFRRRLTEAFAYMGFGDVPFTSHSLRRGAASELFARGVSLMDIAVLGRWASEGSCREYIRRGEYSLLRLRQARPEQVWTRCSLLAQLVTACASHQCMWDEIVPSGFKS
eukprot:10364052-Lingulodinium_polyedra.AAC.1